MGNGLRAGAGAALALASAAACATNGAGAGGGADAAPASMTLSAFYAQYAVIGCQRSFDCCLSSSGDDPTIAKNWQGSVTTRAGCTSATLPAALATDEAGIASHIANGTVVYQGQHASDCLSALAGETCNQFFNQDYTPAACSAMYEGKLALGAACETSEQCPTGEGCIGPLDGAHDCQTIPEEGQPCTGYCPQGLYCPVTSNPVCTPQLGEGSPCNPTQLECVGICGAGNLCTPPLTACEGTQGSPDAGAAETGAGDGAAEGGGAEAGDGASNACAAVSGLVAYFPFDVDTNDYSGNGYNAVGNVALSSNGKIGSAAMFDGSASELNVTGSAMLAGARTLCAWAFPTARTSLGQPLFSGGASGAGDFFSLNASTPNSGGCTAAAANVPFVDHWGSACVAPSSSYAAPPAAWHLLCVAYDGTSSLTFFTDNVASSASGSFFNYAISTLYIGSATIGGTTSQPAFLGLLDEVTVWSRALQPADVAALYNGGAGCVVQH